jgi:hypothetical protein
MRGGARRRPAIRLVVLALLTACHMGPAGAPVPMEGTETDRLAGSWTGSYRNDRGGGHGAILFSLTAGADTARGQVEMTFAPALELYRDTGAGERGDLARRPCTAIDIAIVRVTNGAIRGTLAPYWNPACDCRTVSVFEGRLEGASITGTFVTRREGGNDPLATGRWSVMREAR